MTHYASIRRRHLILTSLVATVVLVPQTRAADSEDGLALTVYSSADPAGFDPQRYMANQQRGYNPSFVWEVPGFGVVKETRTLDVAAGISDVRMTGVAQFIDPTTVSFVDLSTESPAAVLEQNFQFDLVSSEKVIERYLDREIGVLQKLGNQTETIRGTLLSARDGNIVLRTADGVRVLSGDSSPQIQLGDLPDGLITQPTLVWKVQSDRAGARPVRTTYQTDGITWRSDYNLILSADDTSADLGAWVTLMNLSGASYNNARLKLIAGDVQRIQPQQMPMGRFRGAAVPEMQMKMGFEEKSFFEYHLYTLPRRTDVPMNATKQITLFPTAKNVGVEKILVYEGLPDARHWYYRYEPQTDANFGRSQYQTKVDVYVRFANEKTNQLGMPLPKGKVRVYKQDEADGTLEFIGEDLIDHTARDEKVLIRLGQSFDVVGERTQTDYSIDTSRRTITESFKIQVRNHKDAAQKVIVRETLYRWTNWEITEGSTNYEKIDARTIHYELDVPANDERTISYTVRYTW